MVKLRQLRAALAVRETGQIAKAAKKLNVSQPAVSRSILSLESELGTVLFDRSRAGTAQTLPGERFLSRAARAMEQLHKAEKEVLRKTRRSGSNLAAHYLSRHLTDHQMRVAIEVDNIRSITAAAARLKISQPSANRSLRQLEKSLNLDLFRRGAQSMEPTARGNAIIRRMKLAAAELRLALEELRPLVEGSSGRILVGVLPLARTLLVPLAVSRLLDRHETADVSIVDGTYPSLLHELRHGEIDFIVGTIREPPPTPDIASESLFEDDLVLVARPGHPLHDRDRIELRDVQEAKWVLPSKGVPLRENFEKILAQMGCPVPLRVIETDSLAVVRALLLEEDRIAVVSRYQIYHEEKFGLLGTIALPLASSRRLVGITTRDDYLPSPLAEEFIVLLRAVANEISARFASLEY